MLELRESKIEHHEAGTGVFIKSKIPVLPGTLLGFYPGMIMNDEDQIPESKSDIKPYVTWNDGFWISNDKEFPLINMNSWSFEEIMEDYLDVS